MSENMLWVAPRHESREEERGEERFSYDNIAKLSEELRELFKSFDERGLTANPEEEGAYFLEVPEFYWEKLNHFSADSLKAAVATVLGVKGELDQSVARLDSMAQMTAQDKLDAVKIYAEARKGQNLIPEGDRESLGLSRTVDGELVMEHLTLGVGFVSDGQLMVMPFTSLKD
jgi:hypothetical protein